MKLDIASNLPNSKIPPREVWFILGIVPTILLWCHQGPQCELWRTSKWVTSILGATLMPISRDYISYTCRMRDSRHGSPDIPWEQGSWGSMGPIWGRQADQRKHQSSASLAFVRGIHLWPVNSPHKGPVTGKMFPFDVVIMSQLLDTFRHNTDIYEDLLLTLVPSPNRWWSVCFARLSWLKPKVAL